MHVFLSRDESSIKSMKSSLDVIKFASTTERGDTHTFNFLANICIDDTVCDKAAEATVVLSR